MGTRIHADGPPGDICAVGPGVPTWGAAAWTIAGPRPGSGLVRAPGGWGRRHGALSASRDCRPGREGKSSQGPSRRTGALSPATAPHHGATAGATSAVLAVTSPHNDRAGHGALLRLPPARKPGRGAQVRLGGAGAGPWCCRGVGAGRSPGGDGSTRRHGWEALGRGHTGPL